MLDFKFHPSLKKAVYLAIIQYRLVICVLPGILIFFCSKPLNLINLIYAISLSVMLCVYVSVDFYNRGLAIFHFHGLEGYSFGNFGTSNHFFGWDEIELVEPYRYFGLPFLLIRYYGAETPLWLPLFLKYQIKLNLLIIENTPEDNPLHLALVSRGFFKQVPWHSQVKKHKSDRYILESAYNEKIYNCWQNFCVCCLPFLAILLIFNLFIFVPEIRSKSLLINGYFYQFSLGFILTWLASVILFWQFSVKNSYVAVKNEGVEICTVFLGNCHKSFLPWNKIERVERSGWGICNEFRFYLKESIRGINFIPFRIHSLNITKLRRVVMNQTSLDNPLQQAIIKYL